MKGKSICACLSVLSVLALVPGRAPGQATGQPELGAATTTTASTTSAPQKPLHATARLVIEWGTPPVRSGPPGLGPMDVVSTRKLERGALARMGVRNERAFGVDWGDGRLWQAGETRVTVRSSAGPDAEQGLRRYATALAQELEAALESDRAAREQTLRASLDETRARIAEYTKQMDNPGTSEPLPRYEHPADQYGIELDLADLRKQRAARMQEVEDVELKLVTQRARRDAIAEQVAKLGAAASQAATADPVVLELEKVVKLREQKLARAKMAAEAKSASTQAEVKAGLLPVRAAEEANAAATQQVADGEEGLALALAELAKQRQAASQAAGGSLLADLNKELTMLTIDLVETEARHQALVGRATELWANYFKTLRGRAAGVATQMESQLANVKPAKVSLEDFQITSDPQ